MSAESCPPGRVILILIPHPDDEVVGCAAAIGRARAAGARVHGLYLTNGVIARRTLWPWQRRGHSARLARRRAEAERAAAHLGLIAAGHGDLPTRALKDHLPACLATCRAAAARLGVDTIWVPAYEGAHADHDCAHALGTALARDWAVWEFAEYNNAGGRPRAQTFPDPRGDELILTLTPEEAAAKRVALAIYGSEQGNLAHIDVARESFRPLGPTDYGRPPHEGTLFYRRFQWVPFRHPRIDFTTDAEVSAAITRFLGAPDRPGR